MHQFGDLAQALGAEFRNDSTDARNLLQLVLRCLEDLGGRCSDVFFQRGKRGGAFLVAGEVGDVLEQDEFQSVRDRRRPGTAVEFLEFLYDRDKWIRFSHRVDKKRLTAKTLTAKSLHKTIRSG